MSDYFRLLKPKQVLWADRVLLAVGGAVHLLPSLLGGIAGTTIIAPVTIQMVVGGLMVARAVDLFMK